MVDSHCQAGLSVVSSPASPFIESVRWKPPQNQLKATKHLRNRTIRWDPPRILFWWKKRCFKFCKLYLLRSPVSGRVPKIICQLHSVLGAARRSVPRVQEVQGGDELTPRCISRSLDPQIRPFGWLVVFLFFFFLPGGRGDLFLGGEKRETKRKTEAILGVPQEKIVPKKTTWP